MRRILDLLAALERAGVDVVVVGGVAVVLRGHAWMTVHLDLALDLASDNVLAVLEVLTRAGLVPPAAGSRREVRRRRPTQVVGRGAQPRRLHPA